MKNVLKQTLEPLKFVPHEFSSQEYGSTTIELREHIQIKEQKMKEVQEDHIDPTSTL